MKVRLAVFAVILAFGASAADAAILGLGSKKKFPKPIDSPVVRPKVKESHKTGSRVKHLQQSGDAAIISTVERA